MSISLILSIPALVFEAFAAADNDNNEIISFTNESTSTVGQETFYTSLG